MMLDLGKREINELHVEAGQRLNGSLVRERLVDEVVAYIAPTILGQGRDMAAFGPLSDLSQALQLHFTEVTMVGADIRAVARVHGSNVF
jgi:diaminohydroxyphosphoribosylaminopyrimidine deaminase/5-amino-6-(5-phosphoribosylamino)uracil reductase